MIRFLFKGLLRDRSRSLFPFITVTLGVFLTVGMYCYVKGVTLAVVESNAKFETGHLKVMTRAYAEDIEQRPNDLCLLGAGALVRDLEKEFPGTGWAPRIKFGGLLDIPDEKGETRSQGPVVGTAADLLTPGSREPERLDLARGLVRGRLPQRPGEILVSDELAQKLGVAPGEKATLLGTTRYGAMSITNFTVSGTVRFGFQAIDRMGLILDLADAQDALDMADAAGEVLGYLELEPYNQKTVNAVASTFNAQFKNSPDTCAPVMLTLRDQNDLYTILDQVDYATALIIALFVGAMSLVLWNAGLIGNLKRYGEIGVRLAIGERHGRVYRAMLAESLLIGLLGTIAGAAFGLALSYYLQVHGINYGSLMKNAAIMIPNVIHARITPFAYVIGFIPGLLATFIGTAIAGRGIYKRQTSQLFKELET
jgi:putative ABC transport system permease protein